MPYWNQKMRFSRYRYLSGIKNRWYQTNTSVHSIHINERSLLEDNDFWCWCLGCDVSSLKGLWSMLCCSCEAEDSATINSMENFHFWFWTGQLPQVCETCKVELGDDVLDIVTPCRIPPLYMIMLSLFDSITSWLIVTIFFGVGWFFILVGGHILIPCNWRVKSYKIFLLILCVVYVNCRSFDCNYLSGSRPQSTNVTWVLTFPAECIPVIDSLFPLRNPCNSPTTHNYFATQNNPIQRGPPYFSAL